MFGQENFLAYRKFRIARDRRLIVLLSVAVLAAGVVIVGWVAAGAVRHMLSGPRVIGVGAAPDALALSPDGRTLYVANGVSDDSPANGHAVTVVSPTTGKVGRRIDIGGAAWKIAVSPDGRTLYAMLVADSGGQNGMVIVNLVTGHVAARVRFKYGAADFAVAPRGQVVYVLAEVERGSMQVISLDSAGRRRDGVNILVPGDSEDLSISPQGDLLYVAGGRDGARHSGVIEEFPVNAGRVGSSITLEDNVIELAISQDGRTLYALGDNDSCPRGGGACTSGTASVAIIDAVSGKQVKYVHLETSPVALAVARSGRTVYVLSAEGGIIPVSTTTGKAGRGIRVTGMFADPSSLDLLMAPDGRTAYVAEANKGVAIVPLP